MNKGLAFLFFIIIVFAAIISLKGIDIPEKTEETDEIYGFTYTGETINGKYDGEGKIIFDNGDIYIGSFKDGTFDGQGQFIIKDGNSYKGTFYNGSVNNDGE